MSRIPSLGPRGEGWTALQMVVMVSILVAARWADGPRPTDAVLAGGLALVGWLAFACGTLMLTWCVWLLHRADALTALPHPLETGSLVASGPYRLIRHPIYASLVFGAIGVAMYRYSLATLGLALALFLILDVKRRREEAWLADRYPGYDGYRSRTRALVPFLY